MSYRRNFLDADNSGMEKNLRFVRNDVEDNFNQYFGGNNSSRSGNARDIAPPRDYRVVQPKPVDMPPNKNDNAGLAERNNFLQEAGLPRHEAYEIAKKKHFDIGFYRQKAIEMSKNGMAKSLISDWILKDIQSNKYCKSVAVTVNNAETFDTSYNIMDDPRDNNHEIEKNTPVSSIGDIVVGSTIKRKKLSGAQRRKIAKMRMKSSVVAKVDSDKQNVTEVKEQYTPTFCEVAEKFRSSIKQNIAYYEYTHLYDGYKNVIATKDMRMATQGMATTTKEVVMPTRKVVTATVTAESSSNVGGSNWSNQDSMKRRSDTKTVMDHPTSHAKVAKRSVTEEHCYAVIDINNPSGKIPVAHRQCLEEAIDRSVLKYVMQADDTAATIQINSCKFVKDVLMLELTSNSCIRVLRKLVQDIPAPWQGAKLALISKADLLSPIRSSCFIKGRGGKLTTDEILNVIGKQNKGLTVGNWKIYYREERPEGSLLIVGLDQESMASLKETKGKAFFLSSTVYFKLAKNDNGWDV